MSLLEIDALTIRYPGDAGPAVDDLSLQIGTGEALGIVGESGSGKTQTAMAVMGLLPQNAVTSGSIRFDGTELLGAGADMLNEVRACRIAMIFQDPRTALNPYVTIGQQLRRILLEHAICPRHEARERTLQMLKRVGLPDPERQYRSFPHQLSGGMRQRAMIGAALLAEPDLIIADEPTTALDVTVQAQILRLLRELRAESNTALLLITHDLGVIAGNCERMLVLDEGHLVEEGATTAVFASPQAARTRALLAAAPHIDVVPDVPPLDAGSEAVLAIDDIAVSFAERSPRRLVAVKRMSLKLLRGETLAVVGESGSGKTSLARAVLGLVEPDGGRISFLGRPLEGAVRRRPNDVRRRLQMVFQDPLASLNPALSIRDIVGEPLHVHEPRMSRADAAEAIARMLERVGLGPELADRFPHELSGGQAQRVAIARSLIMRPSVLVCDEAVAALDGTVRQEILELLQGVQQRSGLSLIFIAHDLAVVRQISHRVLVMYLGRLFELADNEQLFRKPGHPYTKALLNAVPAPDPAAGAGSETLPGEVSSILNPPAGCVFHPRCQHAIGICRETAPTPKGDRRHLVACHRASELDLSY
jgi:oligopeptide/dipeptide ABC transporter ATP-binding protein